MGLLQFTNAERMNSISEIVREELDKHINDGGLYYDEKAKRIAQQAVVSCMPEMPSFLQEKIVIDSDESLLLEEIASPLKATAVKKLEGVHVLARLTRVELQSFRLTSPELSTDIDFYDYGLFAVMEPRFIDAEPGDIVTGDELYVPFAGVTHFKPAEYKAS